MKIQVTTYKRNQLAGFEPRKLKTPAIAPTTRPPRQAHLCRNIKDSQCNNITTLTYLFLINLDLSDDNSNNNLACIISVNIYRRMVHNKRS